MVRLLPLVLTGVLLFGMQPLHAAATQQIALTPSDAQTFAAWTDFLAGGVQTWSTTPAPAFTPAIESTIWQVLNTDTPAEAISNPMIDYLEWRRSLDPTRFASYHPNLSPALAQLLSSPSLPSTVPQPAQTPPPPTQTTTGAQVLSPPTVPEPSSLLLAAAMAGWGVWWRRRIGRRSSL